MEQLGSYFSHHKVHSLSALDQSIDKSDLSKRIKHIPLNTELSVTVKPNKKSPKDEDKVNAMSNTVNLFAQRGIAGTKEAGKGLMSFLANLMKRACSGSKKSVEEAPKPGTYQKKTTAEQKQLADIETSLNNFKDEPIYHHVAHKFFTYLSGNIPVKLDEDILKDLKTYLSERRGTSDFETADALYKEMEGIGKDPNYQKLNNKEKQKKLLKCLQQNLSKRQTIKEKHALHVKEQAKKQSDLDARSHQKAFRKDLQQRKKEAANKLKQEKLVSAKRQKALTTQQPQIDDIAKSIENRKESVFQHAKEVLEFLRDPNLEDRLGELDIHCTKKIFAYMDRSNNNKDVAFLNAIKDGISSANRTREGGEKRQVLINCLKEALAQVPLEAE